MECPRDEYQCLSGHCVSTHAIHSLNIGWHCPDASDKIGLWRFTEYSKHNAPLIDYAFLYYVTVYFAELYAEGTYVPFSIFCDPIKEYECILAKVDKPLNFTINRPCINRTQIGDSTID